RFPFSGGSSRDVSIPEFSQLFAPNGVIDRFFLQELSQFADLSGSTWSWKTDGPLAGKLSNATLKQFERAASIRDAFFASGGGTPNIAMTFRARMHSQIDVATLDIDGQPVITNRGTNTPTNITWPGSGAGNVTLTFTPALGRRGNRQQFLGAWGFLRFLRQGQPKLNGSTVDVSHILGGRNIGYRIDVAANENPFFLRALSEFKCPKGL
ncbi:MAG: type VI secretion IcmF C-terminal domain-containing protein, partial [Pseudomonadota bacterium]